MRKSGNFFLHFECMLCLIELCSHYKTCGNVILVVDLNTSIRHGNRSYINPGHDPGRINLVCQYLESTNRFSVISDQIFM